MSEGKQIKVQVKTTRSIYEGYLTIPQVRKRLSDVLNDESRFFLNLTDVREITEAGGQNGVAPFVSINKNMIESILELPD